MLPQAIENLAEKLRFFPGVGNRSSLKLALDILQLPEDKFLEFDQSLTEVRAQVCFCTNCGFFAQKSTQIPDETKIQCEICNNSSRNTSQICLVEKTTDVITVERGNVYRGLYHVLTNLISPLDNIFAEDTTINDLVERRLSGNKDKIELILFFKAGFAAEATTAYLKEFLKQKKLLEKVTITRLAQGLPLYYNPETLDQATMAKALEDRREIS